MARPGQINLGTERIESGQLSAHTPAPSSYNPLDELRAENDKLRAMLVEQDQELLRLYRILERYR